MACPRCNAGGQWASIMHQPRPQLFEIADHDLLGFRVARLVPGIDLIAPQDVLHQRLSTGDHQLPVRHAEVVSTGALAAMAIILLVLIQHCLKLSELWKMVAHYQKDLRWAQIWEVENRELRSALRAEREQVSQLLRKVELLQAMLAAAK